MSGELVGKALIEHYHTRMPLLEQTIYIPEQINCCVICGYLLDKKFSTYCREICAREGRRLKHLTRTAEESYNEYMNKIIMMNYQKFNTQ